MTKRILAVSSSGGHWLQLLRLRSTFEGFDLAFATTNPGNADEARPHRCHVIADANRKSLHRLPLVVGSVRRVLAAERPDTIVTTGALPGLVALALGKSLYGARTIWIDSIANAERVSGSGVYAARFADLCLTQWPHLSREKGPDYWGALL